MNVSFNRGMPTRGCRQRVLPIATYLSDNKLTKISSLYAIVKFH